METTINLDEIKNIKKYIDENVNDIRTISDDIVNEYTQVLDDIMKDINRDVINADLVSDAVLEKYFLELTNAIYFLGSKGEFLGLYDDLSKANVKIKYNQAYSDNQIQNIASGKKTTVDENRAYAESASMNDSIVNAIYARSFRIIKTKIESANEMVKTLSKIISKRMNEKDYSDYVNPFNEGSN